LHNEFTSFFVPFIIIVFVIILAYIGTRFISVKYTKLTSGRYLKVIERVALGQDKSLVLINIKAKIYLLGVSGNGINIVSEFNEDEFPAISQAGNTDFCSILTDNFKKMLFRSSADTELNKSDSSSLLDKSFKNMLHHLPVGKNGRKSDRDE